MPIGYIGTGAMGGPIALALARGHEVLAYDRDPAVLAACSAGGVKPCSDPGEVAAACDTIFLCLPGLTQVGEVLAEDSALMRAARPGALVVDQSTSDPREFVTLAGRVAQKRITLIDAPVSGGPAGVQAGTITIMIGGDGAQYQRVAAILGSITPNLFHAGPTGSAMAIKVANNYLAALQAAVAMQVLALTGRLGCDLVTALDVFLRSSGSNYYLERYMRREVLEGGQSMAATIEIMRKDVALALSLADDAGVPLAGREALEQLIQAAIARGGHGASYHSLAAAVEEQSGVRLIGAATH